MNEIKVGERVIGVRAYDDNSCLIDVEGTIIGIGKRYILVQFDLDICGHDGHNNNGLDLDDFDNDYKNMPVGLQHHCWYFEIADFDYHLKFANDYKTELI